MGSAAGGVAWRWKRARQLTQQKCVSLETLKIMRAWFARHGPDARCLDDGAHHLLQCAQRHVMLGEGIKGAEGCRVRHVYEILRLTQPSAIAHRTTEAGAKAGRRID